MTKAAWFIQNFSRLKNNTSREEIANLIKDKFKGEAGIAT